MKPIHAVAAAAMVLALISVAFLISAGDILFTLKALPHQMMRSLSSTFSMFLDHKVPVIITLAVLLVIDFVRKVPVIRSR
ncbi:MAG TPA: hypothetical protein VKB58_01755 [Terriglobales bacterium]|jgi:hypothetical protein|nr:hypothetical protein [Terriglobales bacterium]